jgi:hypothetical protein
MSCLACCMSFAAKTNVVSGEVASRSRRSACRPLSYVWRAADAPCTTPFVPTAVGKRRQSRAGRRMFVTGRGEPPTASRNLPRPALQPQRVPMGTLARPVVAAAPPHSIFHRGRCKSDCISRQVAAARRKVASAHVVSPDTEVKSPASAGIAPTQAESSRPSALQGRSRRVHGQLRVAS